MGPMQAVSSTSGAARVIQVRKAARRETLAEMVGVVAGVVPDETRASSSSKWSFTAKAPQDCTRVLVRSRVHEAGLICLASCPSRRHS